MSNRDDDKLSEELRECTTYCPACGHTVIMMAKTKSCICTHRNNRVINQSRARFKYEFRNAKRKLEEKED